MALVAVCVLVLGILVVLRTQGQGAESSDPGDLGLYGRILDEPSPRPDFTLTTTEGEPFDFAAQTRGRMTLLFFGFTSCPDICPIHLATLADALDQSGVPRPIVVFVSVDPARDTPEVVREYLDRFDTDFIGLVGTLDDVAEAQRAAGVPESVIEPADDNGDYLVGHSAQILVYTSDDLAHVTYPFGVRQQHWAADLPRLEGIDWADAR